MVVIVISGMPGCGSSTATKKLAKRLKLKHFSLGDRNKSYIEKLTGHRPRSQTERSLQMWHHKTGSSKKFHVESEKLAIALAKKGNIVIDAKLGIHFLGKYADLTVWLKAPKSVRIKRYAHRDKKSIVEAKRTMEYKENLERKNWKRIYGFDYFKQEKEADIIINTANKTPNQIVKIILKELKKRQAWGLWSNLV